MLYRHELPPSYLGGFDRRGKRALAKKKKKLTRPYQRRSRHCGIPAPWEAEVGGFQPKAGRGNKG
jgi:hypothetical protein